MKKILLLLSFLLIVSSLYAQQGPSQQVLVSQKITAGGGDVVSDTFTEGSNVNLSSHTGEVGATWTLHSSYSGTITNDSTLDRIYLTSASAALYYPSGTPSSSPCTEADYLRLTSISTNVSIGIRGETGADTGIMLRLNDTGAAQQWEVMDRVAGSNTILNGGAAVTGAHMPSLGGAAVNAKICVSGTSVTVFFDDVQDTGLNSTTGISAAGKAFTRMSGTASSTTGIHLDNFVAQ